MARPLWSGSLSFGLVNVPVVLYSAVRDRGVHFNQLHEPDGSPIETRRVCAHERNARCLGARSPRAMSSRMAAGCCSATPISKPPRRARATRSTSRPSSRSARSTRSTSIVPICWFPRTRARLAHMRCSARRCAAPARWRSGRFVMRAKEHLVSIRPRGELLTLTTMRFHDEVRPSAEIAEEIDVAAAPSAASRSRMRWRSSPSSRCPFEPARYRDEHRAHLQRIIKRKQKGQKISVARIADKPKPKVTPTAPDLMGALEQSLARIRAESPGAGKTKAKKTRATPSAPRRSGSSAKRSS